MIATTHRSQRDPPSSMSKIDSADPDRTIDVREIEGAPFDDIMAELDALDPGETLLLQSSFEPEPLYDVLSQRGFAHETEQIEPTLYHVEIRHD
jgi:uncharacterized protein (DUF2249 family)